MSRLPSGGAPLQPTSRAGLVATLCWAGAAAALGLAGPPVGTWLGPSWTWLRLIVALPAVFLLPGHALTCLLYPRRAGLDSPARLALALGLSLAQLPLCALALTLSPWGLSPAALIATLLSVTTLWSVVALTCGWVGPAGQEAPYAPHPPAARQAGFAFTPLERALLTLCAVLLVAAGTALIFVLPGSRSESLTELYMLGRDGRADSFPLSAAPGAPVGVHLGVTNREGRRESYFVVALAGERVVGTVPPFTVEAGQTWSEPLTVALPEYGFGQRVDVLLFRVGSQTPYRRLRLILDVPPPGAPTPVRILPTAIPRP